MQVNEHPFKPVAFMLISVLSFALMNGCIKYLSHISAYQLVFFRSIGTLLLCTVYILWFGLSPWGNNKKLLLLRGLVGTIGLTFFFMSIKHMPIGSAVTLRYLSPIFAAVLSWLLFKERIVPLRWFFFFMAFIGVVMLKGFDTRISATGLILILTSAIFSGLVYFIISKIGRSEHPMVVVLYFTLVSSIFGFSFSVFSWYVPYPHEWWFIGAVGILGFIGQVFMTKALQIELLSRIAPVKYAEALFTVIVAWIWFGESFGLPAIAGMLLIIIAMIANVTFKRGAQ